MPVVVRGFLPLMMWLFLTAVVHAQERVALVIGNGSYQEVPTLANPVNDATDIGAALIRLGFETEVHTDLTWADTREVLKAFSRKADGADMAVLYFAGHGIEIDNQNYLFPVDASIASARDVTYAGTEMAQFLRAVEGAKTLRLVLLDACRNNPFAAHLGDGTRSATRGLAEIEPPGGVVVGYAARGGTVAFDGEGRNSPYAAALLEHLETPGLEIGRFFRNVRDAVFVETEGKQEPFTYGSLPARDIFLGRGAAPAVAQDSTAVLTDFARASLDNTEAGWMSFLEVYGVVDTDPGILQRARDALSAVRQAEAAPVLRSDPLVAAATSPQPPSLTSFDSPLILACDQFATDPDDPNRSVAMEPLADALIDPNAAITACKLATAGHPDHGRSHHQLGRAHMVAQEPEAAMAAFARAAALDYPAGQVRYADLLISRAGSDAAITEAVALLEAAEAGGNGRAARRLGQFYGAVYSDPSSPTSGARELRRKAIQHYRTGAELGDVDSMVQAGRRLLEDHLSTGADTREARHWLTEAADRGRTDAMRFLGQYLLSDGLQGDAGEGLTWLERAALGSDVDAMRRLVRLHRTGTPLGADGVQWLRWAERLASTGDTEGMLEAGYALEIGASGVHSPSQAARFYVNALIAGDPKVLARPAGDWDVETARAVQALLRSKRGVWYAGALDGQIGPATVTAMAKLCKCQSRTVGRSPFSQLYTFAGG